MSRLSLNGGVEVDGGIGAAPSGVAVTPSPARLRRLLAAVVLALFALGGVLEIAGAFFDLDWAFGLVAVISLDYRGNVPTWFLIALLFLSAGLMTGFAATVRGAGPRLTLACGLTAGLCLAASLVSFADFEDRVDRWLTEPALLQDLAFWAAMAASIGLLCLVTRAGQRGSLRFNGFRAVMAVVAAAAAIELLEDSRLSLRLWFDLGGSESRAILIDSLFALAHITAKQALAGLLCIAWLDALARKRTSLSLAAEP